MDELLEFENTVEDTDGRSYVARVLGREREDGRWVGSIRFTPVDGGGLLETDRETTQPNRDDLRYWSTGLTYFYLEGALTRALRMARSAAAAEPSEPEAPEAPRAPESSEASRAPESSEAPDAPGPEPTGGTADPGATAGVALAPEIEPWARRPVLEIETPDPAVVERLVGAREPRTGTTRDVRDAGTLIYEGARTEGGRTWHRIAVRFASRNTGAVLGNWLWSRLRGAGITARVDGTTVELTQDALVRALLRGYGP